MKNSYLIKYILPLLLISIFMGSVAYYLNKSTGIEVELSVRKYSLITRGGETANMSPEERERTIAEVELFADRQKFDAQSVATTSMIIAAIGTFVTIFLGWRNEVRNGRRYEYERDEALMRMEKLSYELRELHQSVSMLDKTVAKRTRNKALPIAPQD